MNSAKPTVAGKAERRASAPRAAEDATWQRLRAEAEAAVDHALSAPWPDTAEVDRHVFAD